MTGEIHRDDAEAGGNQSRREESILLSHVAKAGNADDERPGAAGVVVGDLSVGQFKELRGEQPRALDRRAPEELRRG